VVVAETAQSGDRRPGPGTASRAGRRRSRGLGLIVLVLGLVVTGLFSLLVHDVDSRTETRLLRLKAREVGAVLSTLTSPLQTALSGAAEIAAATGGDPNRFHAYMTDFVGPGKTFVAASLWRVSDTSAPITTVGTVRLPDSPARFAAFLRSAAKTKKLSVAGPLGGEPARLGYAIAPSGPRQAYVVYVESQLAPRRFAVTQRNQAFSDLRYAIYLGTRPRSSTLLLTNSHTLPLSGRRARNVQSFGTTHLLLIAAPIGHLSGTLSANLWWYVALVGGLFTLAAALAVERLVRQRAAAEGLNAEVRRLLGEQRTIAESLQRALLPKSLPDVADVQIGARYLPGVNGMEIGGDWYDVIPLGEHRLFFVVGDVSGRGVEAGSVMASLRFAIRGFVSEGHPPDLVLGSLARLLDLQVDHHFATVLCGVADVRCHKVVVANAGHLPPVLVADGGSRLIDVEVGTPIGVVPDATYRSTTVEVPHGATLLLYTDGLVERRGETLDTGLQRLRRAAGHDGHGSVEGMLDAVLNDLAHGERDDDTAMLGLRWLR
jgi:serine phosphatase RsbU (regulator of sigma subunit)